jgi:hypothetical protein
MFDHIADSDASAVGSYRSYADAIMGGRYATAAHSQELRRYGPMMLGGFGGGLGIGVGQHHQLKTSLLLEEKLLRLRHEQNRYLEEERAYIALRDQLGAQQQQQAAPQQQQQQQQQQHQQQQQQQQQQQHQQQQAAQDDLFLADSIDRRIAALQEHQAQHRLAAAAAGGAASAGGLGSLGRAASEAYSGYAHAQQLQLVEEAAAIRERLAIDWPTRRQVQQQFQQQEHLAILRE